MILLLLAAAVSDPNLLLANARAKLAASCTGSACGAPPAAARFRIADDDDAVPITAKDRAFRDDGTKCNVVGARRCPKRGRTIFRTDLSR